MDYKKIVCTTIGMVGGAISTVFGGWSAALMVLLICMAVDYITGLVVAGVFHASPNSPNGGLESRAGLKGLLRKGATLLIVLIAHCLDVLLSTAYIREAVVIAFCANEILSIIENAGLMGVPIPKVLTKAIDVLRSKDDESA